MSNNQRALIIAAVFVLSLFVDQILTMWGVQMKTVIDAVNYYGGHNFVNGKHEKQHTHILISHIDSSFFSAYASDISESIIVCTISEYNQCVDELETNFGTSEKY